ncbi:4Fe-4S dicluster domain-containing protein [Adlercreutzia sp. R21]|uniref:4Fe-4S dicluster domain-containing protein n=1 Tax=Adlercreutzia wanghongyangiae TaxID=3111451 RepID=UPI002DBA9E53|nr:4Fe-4S dicluster domain-containing protein [Adlercreutzia sp. R21]MEC4183326.1 4Fe-4S dicluster domain-containing protein [Adlercreutzia sp. R21]
MLYRVIDRDDLPSLVAAFMERYEVIAPVKRGEGHVFSAVADAADIVLDYPTTVASPKKYLLPAVETLFEFDAEGNAVTDYTDEVRPRVLFGVHACDINAIMNLNSVFDDARYPDPYYQAHRAATLIVGVGCMPQAHCFCNLMDAEEARPGYDLFLTDIGERYLVSIGSVVGANILEGACEVREATDEDRIAFRAVTRARQEAFNGDIPDIQEIPMLMDAFHEDAFWDELGGRCLSCNACANVCPTCYCFDIRDTLDPGGATGRRERVWDACTSPQFAMVAGGHNFRPTAAQRVRHRMYHKLNGFMAKYDRSLCVGCGRCATACKVDISPIEVLRFFERKGAEDAE